jgi:hypothetical protein
MLDSIAICRKNKIFDDARSRSADQQDIAMLWLKLLRRDRTLKNEEKVRSR